MNAQEMRQRAMKAANLGPFEEQMEWALGEIKKRADNGGRAVQLSFHELWLTEVSDALRYLGYTVKQVNNYTRNQCSILVEW